MFKPVPARRAYENIVTGIEQNILEGQLEVGGQLPSERELAEEFAVSRVVIREAVRHLEAKGVLEVRHGSGTYVKAKPGATIEQSLTLLLKLEESSLRDLYVVRQALELVSVPRAAQHSTRGEIDSLRQCLFELRDLTPHASDSDEAYLAFIAKDTTFHCLIADASHNLPLATILRSILPLMNSGRLEIMRQAGAFDGGTSTRVALGNRHEPRDILEELTNIFTAIVNRDPQAAEHFIYLHLQRAIAGFQDLQQ